MRVGLVRARKVVGKWHCSKMCPLSGVMKSLEANKRMEKMTVWSVSFE